MYVWLTDGTTAILNTFTSVIGKVSSEPVLALFASAAVIFLVIAMVRRLMSA